MKKRKTIQKQLVFDSVQHLTNHPTAEDIYADIYPSHPSISKGTIYRNLNSLAADGDIKRISVPDSADRFDKTVVPHYHIKCSKCDMFMDINMPYMQNIDDMISEDIGFILENHDIVFRGICPKCAKNNIDKKII